MAFYDQVTIRVANTEAQQVKIVPSNIQEILIVGTNNAYRVKIVLASGRSYFLLDTANKSTFNSLEEAAHVVDYFITLITDPEISRTVIDREIPEDPLPDHVPSTELFKAELDKKVDIIPGKGLSSNDFTNIHLVKVNKLRFDGDKNKFLAEDGEYRSIDASVGVSVVQEITEDALDTDVLAVKPLKAELDKKLNKIENVTQTLDGDFADDIVPSANITKEELSKKVDKVEGKGLSTNDYTTAEKTKLSGIEPGAQVNVQSDWNQTLETAPDFIKNKPKFATDRDITALLNVGAIEPQDLIPQGTTLTEFIEKLVLTTFYPTYTEPSFSVTFRVNGTTTTTYEVGTVVDMTFVGTLDRGSITGAISNGIWVPTLSQNPRSGPVDYFILAGTNTGTTNTHTILNYTVQLGTQSFQSSANYLQGPQPTDSKGNNYQTPLPAGRTNVVTSSITGRRALFYGVNNPASDSSDIRELSNKTLNPTNGTKFTINIPAGASNVVFAYPATLRNVSSVKYVEGLGAEVKDAFTMTTFDVEGANGFTAIPYKVYKYTPVEPFGSTATYEVTI